MAPPLGDPMLENEYLEALYAALARETNQAERERLLTELDRATKNSVKRERTVPAMERR